MKFDCGKTREEKRDKLTNWHKWYAWYPVRIGSHNCRWLEYVERKLTYVECGWDYYTNREYRTLEDGELARRIERECTTPSKGAIF
jgi:hypothetical protein